MEKSSVTLLREEFFKAVTIANRFVPLRPSLPVLGNILINPERGDLNLSTTNLETSLQIKIPAKVTSPWSTTIPAKTLNEFLASTTGKEVSLTAEKEGVLVNTDNAQAVISTIAASEFPKLPEANNEKGIEFVQKELQQAVSQVAFAASVDEGKPVLTGVLIRNEGDKTIVVATDGYRLSKKQLKTKYKLTEILIGAKTLVEVLKIAAELSEDKVVVSVSEKENQVLFAGDSFVVSSRLLSGTFPNFSTIIPTKFETSVLISKTELSAAIKTAAVFALDIGNVVKLHLDPKKGLNVSANTLQLGEGEAKVDAKINGPELKVAFNSRFLLDGLAALKEEQVEINFSGTLSPALLRDKDEDSFIHIVMPVKAQN